MRMCAPHFAPGELIALAGSAVRGDRSAQRQRGNQWRIARIAVVLHQEIESAMVHHDPVSDVQSLSL
jgi:hypothetical protein